MATEDSSNSMVFSDLIVDLLKEHGIPDEKMSQLKADFIKVPFKVIQIIFMTLDVKLLLIFLQ